MDLKLEKLLTIDNFVWFLLFLFIQILFLYHTLRLTLRKQQRLMERVKSAWQPDCSLVREINEKQLKVICAAIVIYFCKGKIKCKPKSI